MDYLEYVVLFLVILFVGAAGLKRGRGRKEESFEPPDLPDTPETPWADVPTISTPDSSCFGPDNATATTCSPPPDPTLPP